MFGFVGYCFTMWAVFSLGQKDRQGWIIALGSNAAWLTHALLRSDWALVLLNCTLVVLNVMGYRRWGQSEKSL